MTQHKLLRTLAMSLLVAGGCTPPRPPAVKVAATPTPAASPTPYPVRVVATGVSTTLFDEQGHTVAQIKAQGASAGPDPTNKTELGNLQNGKATLFQDNHPASTFAAGSLVADQRKRVLTGTGGVTLQSQGEGGVSSVRADTMVWRYADNKVVGRGHVVFTRTNPDARLTGETFEADTAVRRVTLHTSGKTATGAF